MKLSIVTVPTPTLRQRSVDVDQFAVGEKKIQELITAMIPEMYDDDGIGLAAPQVGHNIRICIIGKEADPALKEDLALINPVWQRLSKKTSTDTEGCLSVPGVYGKVKRYSRIHVSALNRAGQPVQFEAKNFFARVIQHEVDHLDGILFIDKATDLYTIDPVEHAKSRSSYAKTR